MSTSFVDRNIKTKKCHPNPNQGKTLIFPPLYTYIFDKAGLLWQPKGLVWTCHRLYTLKLESKRTMDSFKSRPPAISVPIHGGKGFGDAIDWCVTSLKIVTVQTSIKVIYSGGISISMALSHGVYT